MSQVLEDVRVETDLKIDTDSGDHDLFAHYVKQDDIVAATFHGKVVFALCGKQWVANRSPVGLPVCPTCQEVYDDPSNFKPEDEED